MISLETLGTTAIVTLQRPERRNALSQELMRRLLSALEELDAGAEVQAVVLASSGAVFSSGHDLTELTGRDDAGCAEVFALCERLMTRIQTVRMPVIAEVQGLATAAGCQLVATCDLAIASEDAAFATPGVKIGLFCSTPMVALSRNIGRKRALEMLLTGRLVSAREAEEWGLVNRVVAASELRAATLGLARQITQSSPYTIRVGKQAFYRQIELAQDEAYSFAGKVMAENAQAEDAQEGIQAFLGKRAPCWRGR